MQHNAKVVAPFLFSGRFTADLLRFGNFGLFKISEKTEEKTLNTESLRNIRGYSEFKAECKFCKCKDEYPGWTGEEKYIIFTKMSRCQLEAKYPAIVEFMAPYILICTSAGDAVADYSSGKSLLIFLASHT